MNQPNKTIKGKLLVVEDDLLLARMYQLKLSKDKYDVVVALNGKEALDKINSGYTPQVILLDIMMPVMNGLEFLEEFNKNPENKKIPVIVLTNLSDDKDNAKSRALELGAIDYLMKDRATPREVIDKVEYAIRRG